MTDSVLPYVDIATWIMLGLTVAMMWQRLSDHVTSNLALGYMFVVMIYYRGFNGTLDTWPVFLYLVCVVFLRVDVLTGLAQKTLRFVEFAFLAYIGWRLIGHVLGWSVGLPETNPPV